MGRRVDPDSKEVGIQLGGKALADHLPYLYLVGGGE